MNYWLKKINYTYKKIKLKNKIMGFGASIQKMRDKMKKAMRDKVAKVKEVAKKAEKERDDKGLTTQEYIDAKNNGTLASLPIVNSDTGNVAGSSDNTSLYLMGAVIVGLGVWYIMKKKKK
tara:strand:- start:1137 stop:1496 length:360 start_codon:yes stop_codon:yes gene_type:complete